MLKWTPWTFSPSGFGLDQRLSKVAFFSLPSSGCENSAHLSHDTCALMRGTRHAAPAFRELAKLVKLLLNLDHIDSLLEGFF